MDKETGVHVFSGILLLSIWNERVDQEDGMLRELSQTQREALPALSSLWVRAKSNTQQQSAHWSFLGQGAGWGGEMTVQGQSCSSVECTSLEPGRAAW